MRYFLPLVLISLLLACTNNANRTSDADSSGAMNGALSGTEMVEHEQKIKREQYFIWDVDADKKTISKNPQLQPEYFNIDTLIAGLNEKYPEVLLEKVDVRKDTLYTIIRNAEFLTNQMGSHGAEQYIAQAVINLTSVEGIRYVKIDFREGSHAAPDTWSREQFAGYQERQDDDLQ